MHRKRSGVSTILGAVFFIMVTLSVLFAGFTMFNSFNNYGGAVQQSSNLALIRGETSVALSTGTSGGLPSIPVATSYAMTAQPNTQGYPIRPVANMNFTNNMNGWVFTKTSAVSSLSTIFASVCQSPTTTPTSSSTTYTTSVTHPSGSQSGQDIAQYSVTVDPAFTVGSSQPSPPSGWTVSVAGNTITWNAIIVNGGYEPNDIDNGDPAVNFQWTATAPSSPGTYTMTQGVAWVGVNHDAPPIDASGSLGYSTTVTVGGGTGGSLCQTIYAGSQQVVNGATGGFDASFNVNSESGPGSLFESFEPLVGGAPPTSGSYAQMMNFSTTFTISQAIATQIASASASFYYSIDMAGNVASGSTISLLLIQGTGVPGSGGAQTTLWSGPATAVTTGSFVSVSIPNNAKLKQGANTWTFRISTYVTLNGGTTPAVFQAHFDDAGIRLLMSSSSYAVDSWSQYGKFFIQTGTPRSSMTSVTLTLVLSTTSGPDYVNFYLNDFSRGTISLPVWDYVNSTYILQGATVTIKIPSNELGYWVDPNGNIMLRINSISSSPFVLTTTLSYTSATGSAPSLTIKATNNSPFSVHLVSLYVNGPAGLSHFDANYTTSVGVLCYAPPNACPFSIWLNSGESQSLSIPVAWQGGQTYVITLDTSTGVLSTLTIVTPSQSGSSAFSGTLQLSPTTGIPGSTTSLSGTGYASSTAYSACLSSSLSYVACFTGSTTSFTTDAYGNIPSGTSVTVPSGTLGGAYYVIVYQGGAIYGSASFTVQDFSISASPSSIVLTSGGSSKTSTVTVTSLQGFTGTVSLTASTQAGLTVGLSPTFVTLGTSGTSTLTLSSSQAGSYQVTVTGTSQGISHIVVLSVTVVNFGLDPNSASSGVAQAGDSPSVTISTTNPGDVIYACVYTKNNPAGQSSLTVSITDTSGMVWTSRGSQASPSSNQGYLQCWYGVASGALSNDVVTGTTSSSGGAVLNVVSISGANTNAPSDPNLSQLVGAAGTSQGTSSSVSITTTNAKDIVLSFVGTTNGQTFSAGSGFTIVSNLHASQSGASEYDAVTSAQTGLAAGFSWGGNAWWTTIADAVVKG